MSERLNNVDHDGHRTRLCDCPECERDMVQPTNVEIMSNSAISVIWVCANCGWLERDFVALKEALMFGKHLKETREQIEFDSESPKGLIAAIKADLVLPEDF